MSLMPKKGGDVAGDSQQSYEQVECSFGGDGLLLAQLDEEEDDGQDHT